MSNVAERCEYCRLRPGLPTPYQPGLCAICAAPPTGQALVCLERWAALLHALRATERAIEDVLDTEGTNWCAHYWRDLVDMAEGMRWTVDLYLSAVDTMSPPAVEEAADALALGAAGHHDEADEPAYVTGEAS